MPKPYSVTPRQRTGRRVYDATFRNSTGKRVTRSLGTDDLGRANLIAQGLVVLWQRRVDDPLNCPPGLAAEAKRLYFGYSADRGDRMVEAVLARPGAGGAAEPPDMEELVHDHAAAIGELVALRAEVLTLAAALNFERAEHEALKSSALAHAAAAARNCPPMAEVLTLYRKHLQTFVSASEAGLLAGVARRFSESLPEDVGNPAQITPGHVGAWLDSVATGDKPAVRRGKMRIRVGRWMNWAARQWGFTSPMTRVPGPRAEQIKRERGEIHWHDLADAESALDNMPARLAKRRGVDLAEVPEADAAYWRALVATLAFAGLRFEELVWIRNVDLDATGTTWSLRVANVDDGHGGRHAVKTGEERTVQVSPRLRAHLRTHIAAGGAGEVFLFPARRRRKRQGPGHPERWSKHTLSRWLRGDRRKTLKRALPGLLPVGMNPSSLRRTFGSLLLRSGKSIEEVAAAMGNTPDVVRGHYARILGAEVSVDF